MEDVVVGEGEFCSAEPVYKVGRIPLGPNAAAVIVKTVYKGDAYVWRPTTMALTLEQSVGTKIAWPADKVIVDNGLESPTDDLSGGSSASLGRIIILDWNSEDVIVAEGRLYSTEPKELVNNVPLGPNAAAVKVEKVVKPDAYLWRPSSEMFLMGNALHEFIAWPIQKIQQINLPSTRTSPLVSPRVSPRVSPLVSPRASPKPSSPGSVSCSIENTTSGTKNKCLLLDCNNSGQIVAEGKVCSTNPEDTVHFVPLGPNASKVWVEVIKIGDAKVWRPNSEVDIVSDALGTTVAWPNDKLKFI